MFNLCAVVLLCGHILLSPMMATATGIGTLPAIVTDPSPYQCTYSFFFFTYRQPFAAKAVFDRVRLFYPSAPIYILTDRGGIDLSYFCRNDSNCQSTLVSSVKFGHAYKAVQNHLTQEIIDTMYVYFDHMARAAEWGGCEFMLHLEEDVWYNRALTEAERPPADAGGGNNNKTNDRFSLKLQKYMVEKSGNPNLGILLYIAGGSYFRSAALIDSVRNYMRKLDWFTLHSLDNKIASAWDTVPAVLFHLSGYKTAYWPAVCSRPVLYKRYYRKSCQNATIMHKNVGNPAKAMYLTHRMPENKLVFNITSYEQLLSLDFSKYNRQVVK
mmetsp:Transcript_17509/g.29351  ORF Transcript_17509/g.29351 Transcript_17509/m.29351 type:complete len:326 (-) Transcript_17509:36-1013(-)